jgi:1-acyl-sn-glycerol-3-phosphate acyltransferase
MSASPTSAERRAVNPVLRPLLWLALQAHLLLLALISISWNLVALLLYPLLPRAQGLRVGRAMIAFGYGAFWRVAAFSRMLHLESGALDALRHEHGLIVVANHPSMLDAVMLVARLPRSACIMKAGLMRNPFLGPGARLARYIRNDSTYGMIHCAVQDLQGGGQLVLFPEGTRTTREGVGTFHASFTLIAKRAGVPIQTVFIDTDSPYLGKGWSIARLPPLPIRFTVRLGRRFAPQADHRTLCGEIEGYFAAGVRVRRPDA